MQFLIVVACDGEFTRLQKGKTFQRLADMCVFGKAEKRLSPLRIRRDCERESHGMTLHD